MDHATRERVAMLCDEMLRRGVPVDLVKPIVDHLDDQRPTGSPRRPHAYHVVDGRWMPCMHCGLPYEGKPGPCRG